ncbi:hypothetical protein [Nonomuraea fuscirosea]|uniref:hypothetical protein n=1 Tax=Nonomuraea fuscirosea TaxID=1291556 RepID=UPI003441C951
MRLISSPDTENVHGWVLCTDGAQRAASTAASMADSSVCCCFVPVQLVTGVARAVTDPGEAARLKALLRTWVAGGIEQVIRIRPEITTGFRLVPVVGAPERTEADLRG